MTYQELKPHLRAFKIVVRDKEYHQLTEQEAKRRIVKTIQAGKVRPDELYVVVM